MLLYQIGIIIEVWDRDPAAPVRRYAASDEEGGRGLAIVTALCKQWHYCPSSRGGKVVWAELTLPPSMLSAAGLPRRMRSSRWLRSATMTSAVTLCCCAGYTRP